VKIDIKDGASGVLFRKASAKNVPTIRSGVLGQELAANLAMRALFEKLAGKGLVLGKFTEGAMIPCVIDRTPGYFASLDAVCRSVDELGKDEKLAVAGDAAFACSMTWIQLILCLAGNANSPHSLQIFPEYVENKFYGVSHLDCGGSFSLEENFSYSFSGKSDSRPCLPPAIEDKMLDALKSLNGKDLSDLLTRNGLTDGQVAACLKRRESMVKFYEGNPKRVIREEDWGNNSVLKAKGFSEKNWLCFAVCRVRW
jgi:hypothetical protein